MFHYFVLLGALLSLFLSGCAMINQEAAPVVELSKTKLNANLKGKKHTVKPGETLYSIAWRYGVDYRLLAQINQINAPFIIRPGQTLELSLTIVKPAKSLFKKGATTQALKPPVSFPVHTPAVNPQWIWPVKGPILRGFANHGNNISKGIDIAGTFAQPVHAANDGKVVYSGQGLRGYGQLIIIKHNETFLSAYAHNSRLVVSEGQQVKRGQVIAYMGQSDSNRVMLHFEIRKNGQPIDPIFLLPPK